MHVWPLLLLIVLQFCVPSRVLATTWTINSGRSLPSCYYTPRCNLLPKCWTFQVLTFCPCWVSLLNWKLSLPFIFVHMQCFCKTSWQLMICKMSFTLLAVHREIIFCVGSVEMEVWERHFSYIIVHSSHLNYFSSAFLPSEKCRGKSEFLGFFNYIWWRSWLS